jgi:hypothetical protein
MRTLFQLFSLIAIPVLMLTGIFYTVAKILGGIVFNPESSAWKRLVEQLRGRLKAQAAGSLVPWDGEMLSLLSLNQTAVRKSGWLRSHSEGVFITIYQEPVLAYATQQSGKDRVTIACTSDREFIFRQKNQETEIWLDGQPFAVLVKETLLAAGKQSRMLARLEWATDQAVWPILIGDKTGAALQNPNRADSPNPRAVTMMRPLSREEENVVLALAIHSILKR